MASEDTRIEGSDESLRELRSKVIDGVFDIAKNSAEDNIVIVTHTGPIRALLSAFCGIPYETALKIKIAYGEIIKPLHP